LKPYIVFDSDKLSAKKLENKLNSLEKNNYEVSWYSYDKYGRFVLRHYEPSPPPPRILARQERERLGDDFLDWAHQKKIKISQRAIVYYLTVESGLEVSDLDFGLLWTYIDIEKKVKRKEG
jgi:hypothetical protein